MPCRTRKTDSSLFQAVATSVRLADETDAVIRITRSPAHRTGSGTRSEINRRKCLLRPFCRFAGEYVRFSGSEP